jgi:hypothetical protein
MRKTYTNIEEMIKDIKEKNKIKDFLFTVRCKLELWFIDIPRDFFYDLKAELQRGKRGWAVKDTWNLGNYLNKVIIESMTYFRDNPNTYPCDMTPEKWKKILNKIIRAFELQKDEKIGWFVEPDKFKRSDYNEIKKKLIRGSMYRPATKKECQEYFEGWNLFRKHFDDLWD